MLVIPNAKEALISLNVVAGVICTIRINYIEVRMELKSVSIGINITPTVHQVQRTRLKVQSVSIILDMLGLPFSKSFHSRAGST